MWENCQQARHAAGEINHITGEAHYLALALPRRGLVLTIHDTGAINGLSGWKRRLFHYIWFRLPVRRAAAVTFISDFSQRAVESLVGFKLPHARVIPDPVSPAFVYSPKEFPKRRPRVLCLGSKPNKNLERLAEALRGLDVELRLIGEPLPSQAEAFRQNNITVSLAQNLSVAEIVEEYQMADIVSLISTFEGFGLPIVEGQATGRPVITSSIEPMADTAGPGALLVNPEDVSAMRTGFEQLLCDAELRSRLVDAGRINVRRFDPETIAHQYTELYEELLAE